MCVCVCVCIREGTGVCACACVCMCVEEVLGFGELSAYEKVLACVCVRVHVCGRGLGLWRIVLFDSMLGDEMETTRAGIFDTFRACIAMQPAWRVCSYKTFDRIEGEDGEVEDFSDEV